MGSMVEAPMRDQARGQESHAEDSPTIIEGEHTSFKASPKGCPALEIIMVLIFKNNTRLLDHLEVHKENKNHHNPTMWPSSSLFCVCLCKYVYIIHSNPV